MLLGHGRCNIILETSENFRLEDIEKIVQRIAGNLIVNFNVVPQDPELAKNQKDGIRCGDNGIFAGIPVTVEEKKLCKIAYDLYSHYPYDGKYLLDGEKLIICQSNAKNDNLRKKYKNAIINPLGEWTGGLNVDCGATNRKLGSDMGHSVTGGGLHGKDLSKGDVSINIYAWLKAQQLGKPVEISCAIGDEKVDGKPYQEIVDIAAAYIRKIGGFEKFAEWGYRMLDIPIDLIK